MALLIELYYTSFLLFAFIPLCTKRLVSSLCLHPSLQSSVTSLARALWRPWSQDRLIARTNPPRRQRLPRSCYFTNLPRMSPFPLNTHQRDAAPITPSLNGRVRGSRATRGGVGRIYCAHGSSTADGRWGDTHTNCGAHSTRTTAHTHRAHGASFSQYPAGVWVDCNLVCKHRVLGSGPST